MKETREFDDGGTAANQTNGCPSHSLLTSIRRALGHLLEDISYLFGRLFGLALVALFAEMGYAIMQMAALPLYLRSTFRMPDGRPLDAWIIGIVVSTFLVAETFLKVPFGILSDRYGRKPFIVLGTLISGLTPLGMRVANSPYWFLPLRAIDGIGAAALWPTVFASVAALTSSERRVAAMSIFNMTYLIGASLALPMYSLVFAHAKHHANVFLVVSGVFLVAAVLSVAFVPKIPKGLANGEESSEAGAQQSTSVRLMLKLAASNRTIMLMMVLSLVYTLGINLLSGTISLWAKEVLGLREERIGFIFLIPGLVIVALAVPLGWLGGKWGRLKSVRFGITVAAIAMWILPHTRSVATVSMVIAPLVVGFLMATPAWMAMVTEAAPQGQQGMVVGAVSTAQGIGAMVSPAIGGRLYDWSPSWPFYGAAVLITAASVIVFKYFKDPSSQAAASA